MLRSCFILFSPVPFFPSEDQEILIRSHGELYLRFECRQRVLESGLNAYDIVLILRSESPRALSVVTIGKFARLKTCTVCRSDSPPFTISTAGARVGPSATYASQERLTSFRRKKEKKNSTKHFFILFCNDKRKRHQQLTFLNRKSGVRENLHFSL